MQKTFDITIDDQQPVNPNNSFAIYRGDNVAFNFTFQRGGTALDVEGSTLRIFAKKLGKNGLDKLSNPLFAGDFVESNTATFDSSQTSGDAGNYVLSVLLLSSENAVITSQCIYFELKENGYAGYYQPSQDYRDAIFEASQNVIDAKVETKQYSESAKTSEQNAKDSEQSAKASEQNAKASENTARALSQYAEQYSRNAEQSANDCAEAVAIVQSVKDECLEAEANAEYYARQSKEASDKAIAISDPDGWRTSTEANITTLSQIKSNRGELWFNGGSMACANKFTLDGAFSCVWTGTLNYDDMPHDKYANGSDVTNFTWVRTCTHAKRNIGFHVGVAKLSEGKSPSMWFQFYYDYNAETDTSKFISKSFTCSYYDNKPHIFAIVFDGSKIRFLIDDVEKASGVIEGELKPTICNNPLTVSNANYPIIHKISRIKYFNFDITNSEAPYTLADYIAGKDEPPNSALLSLADYSFNGEVLDNSGKGNHATITGNVKGTNDNAVESLFQKFASRIQNLTA